MSDSGSLDTKQEPQQNNTRILRDNDVIASAIFAQGSHAEYCPVTSSVMILNKCPEPLIACRQAQGYCQW